jgi:hypothetical protein
MLMQARHIVVAAVAVHRLPADTLVAAVQFSCYKSWPGDLRPESAGQMRLAVGQSKDATDVS